MIFPLKTEELRGLFWRIFLLMAAIAPAFYFIGFFKPYQEELPWLYLFVILYVFLLFFLFLYLRAVFSRENIDKMAEISSVAEEIQADKLASLGTMTAGIAHEINNPIGIILGFCSLLVEKTDPESQLYKDLKTIERQGLYCKQIVDNLMNFTRPGHYQEGQVDLNSLIEKTMTVVGSGLKAQGVFWDCSLASDLPQAPGNLQKWQQVLLNLINNAKTAMPGGGKLEIWTAKKNQGGIIELGFQDNGKGIPSDNLSRIFDPFFTTKREGRGIGLGLSISYGIISNYGGTITCRSRTKNSPNQPPGTTFLITIPASDQSH